jgi:hypothetical protein
VTLAHSNVLAADQLERLIRQSYKLVEAKAPKGSRLSTKLKPRSLRRRPKGRTGSKGRTKRSG